MRELSRKERKQLDREIPWREILKRGPEVIEASCEALRKEESQFKKWEPVRPCSSAEAARILSNPKLKKFVLRSRVAYRDKNCGQPPLNAKARAVAVGCSDGIVRLFAPKTLQYIATLPKPAACSRSWMPRNRRPLACDLGSPM